MRKGRVLSLKSCNTIIEFVIKNRVLLILSLFFITGFMISVFTAGKYEAFKNWNVAFLNDFILDRTNKTVLEIAIKSFFNYMIFIMLGFTFGTSVLGAVFVPIVVGVRSFLFGGMAAALYSEYSFKGIAFYTVLVLPSAVVFVFGFLFAMCEALNFSLMLTRLTMPQTMPINISFQFKRFCIKYLLVLIIIVFAAFIDAVLCGNFLTAFSLN